MISIKRVHIKSMIGKVIRLSTFQEKSNLYDLYAMIKIFQLWYKNEATDDHLFHGWEIGNAPENI